ncbi:hypothetical protein ACFL2C_04340 [Patescibacteria group bacterium]
MSRYVESSIRLVSKDATKKAHNTDDLRLRHELRCSDRKLPTGADPEFRNPASLEDAAQLSSILEDKFKQTPHLVRQKDRLNRRVVNRVITATEQTQRCLIRGEITSNHPEIESANVATKRMFEQFDTHIKKTRQPQFAEPVRAVSVKLAAQISEKLSFKLVTKT